MRFSTMTAGLIALMLGNACGASPAQSNRAIDAHSTYQERQASSPELAARLLQARPETLIFVNREQLNQTLIGTRLVQWSNVLELLPSAIFDLPGLEDQELTRIEASDWFAIAIQGSESSVLGRAGRDVYTLGRGAGPLTQNPAPDPELRALMKRAALVVARELTNADDPVRGFRLTISVEHGLQIELRLFARPERDPELVAALLSEQLASLRRAGAPQLLRARALFDDATMEREPDGASVFVSLSEEETRNLVTSLDLTYEEMLAAGSLEAWTHVAPERAQAQTVYFLDEPERWRFKRLRGATLRPGSAHRALRYKATGRARFRRGGCCG